MSEQKMRPVTDTAGKNRQPVQPYQPVWMARWMKPSSSAGAQRQNHSACGIEELDRVSRGDGLTNALDASRPVKEFGVIKAKTLQIVKSSENERACWSDMKHGRDIDDKQALRQVFGHNVECGKTIDWKTGIQLSSGFPSVQGTSLKGCNSLGEGTSMNPTKDRSFRASKPLLESIAGSSAHIEQHYDPERYNFGKGKAAASPLIMKPSNASNNQLPNANMGMLEQEHCYKNSHPADLICKRKRGIHSESDTSTDACFRGFNTFILCDVPSTSDHRLPMVGEDMFQKMQKDSGISLLPSQCIASENTEPKKSRDNFYSLQKLPNCVHDMKTMRICTTVDSVEATPGSFPGFSQTTNSLLITKKTEDNLLKDVIRTTRCITEMNGNTSGELHSLSAFSGLGNRGVRLQPLSSSSNSEGKRNGEDGKASKVTVKNVSSAETDTIDMDISKEYCSNPGANYTPSTKIDAASCREVGNGSMNTGLPDVNLELPALPAVASPSENACSSSSRTQSLEMDALLEHAKHPKRKISICLDDSTEADPIMRWVKRLKLISSNSSSQDRRSSALAEKSSPEEIKRFFRKNLVRGIASSEPTPRNHPSGETILLNKSGDLSSKDNEELTTGLAKKDKELLLSHAWIKRWLRNGSGATRKKPETVTICEPKSSIFTPDNFQRKQFPSTAAMALMGKVMNASQSCELQKRDSFTVWNTQGFVETL